MPGRAIIRTSWLGDLLFAATAVPLVAGLDVEPLAIIVALMLFAVSLVVWVWAFAVAVARSAQGDDIVVSSLFLIEGTAPRAVRVRLFGSVGACLVITAITASANPFGVLVPMLPVGLVGLWGARHGEFGRRPEVRDAERPLRPSRPGGTGRTRRSAGGRAGA